METLKEKIDYAAERFGFEAISNQLIEEMSELTKALCKLNRLNGLGMPPAKEITEAKLANDIVEELADVKVTFEQMVHLMNAEDGISEIIAFKVKRTYERMGWNEGRKNDGTKSGTQG